MIQMSREQLLEKYGQIPVVFYSYYKYTFFFVSEDNKLRVNVGGLADEIYRLEVLPGKKYFLSDLPFTRVSWEGKEVYSER